MFSLGSSSSRIQTWFLVPRPTRYHTYKVSVVFAYAAITSFGQAFQLVLLTTLIFYLTRVMIVLGHKSDYSTKVKSSDLVLCDVTTPYKHWPISHIYL